MNYIIFGSSGFIGAHLKMHLRVIDPVGEIHCCDLHIENEDAFHHRIDVRKAIDIPGQFGANTVIYNLAAIHKTPGHPDQDYFHTNICGAENVCDFARRKGILNIVFTSSIAPYGAAEDEKSEATIPTPNTPYGISKLVAEKIHQIWQAEGFSRHLVIVRPGIVFGQGEGGNFTRLYKALKKGLFAYAGRRDTCKAAIYVKDLVRVMDLMSRNMTKSFQLYNCCAPQPLSIEEIAQTVQKVCGIRRFIPSIPAGILRSAALGLGMLDSLGLGFHPDRVKKLMISTRINGEKLNKDYPLAFSLESALQDWWKDCNGAGLE